MWSRVTLVARKKNYGGDRVDRASIMHDDFHRQSLEKIVERDTRVHGTAGRGQQEVKFGRMFICNQVTAESHDRLNATVVDLVEKIDVDNLFRNSVHKEPE